MTRKEIEEAIQDGGLDIELVSKPMMLCLENNSVFGEVESSVNDFKVIAWLGETCVAEMQLHLFTEELDYNTIREESIEESELAYECVDTLLKSKDFNDDKIQDSFYEVNAEHYMTSEVYVGCITYIEVEPDFRGLGIAKTLLRNIEHIVYYQNKGLIRGICAKLQPYRTVQQDNHIDVVPIENEDLSKRLEKLFRSAGFSKETDKFFIKVSEGYEL